MVKGLEGIGKRKNLKKKGGGKGYSKADPRALVSRREQIKEGEIYKWFFE